MSNFDRALALHQAASDLCEEIRAQGTHQRWKPLAHVLDAIEEDQKATGSEPRGKATPPPDASALVEALEKIANYKLFDEFEERRAYEMKKVARTALVKNGSKTGQKRVSTALSRWR
jgi:hypothetical protein